MRQRYTYQTQYRNTGDDGIDARLYTWHSRVESALSGTQAALRDAEQLGYEDPALDGLNAALKAVLTPRPVAPLLVGSTWLVEDVEGGGVIDFLQSTLTFDSAEKVTGMGGCNNFFGSVKIDGGAIEFGPLGATRKACGEAIDDQEFRFFQALEKVRTFEIDQGLLFLLDNDGTQVVRLSRKS